ncbi:MAG: type IV pilus modification PilV family protein [Trichloromonadaceae bacterium]
MTDRTRNAGFTLLEIMIALAIVAIALVSLLGLANRSIAVQERLQRMTRGTLLAQEKMTEIELAAETKTLVFEPAEGIFAEPFSDFRWRMEFADTPLPVVTQVTVTVAWGAEERNEAVDLSNFLLHE